MASRFILGWEHWGDKSQGEFPFISIIIIIIITITIIIVIIIIKDLTTDLISFALNWRCKPHLGISRQCYYVSSVRSLFHSPLNIFISFFLSHLLHTLYFLTLSLPSHLKFDLEKRKHLWPPGTTALPNPMETFLSSVYVTSQQHSTRSTTAFCLRNSPVSWFPQNSSFGPSVWCVAVGFPRALCLKVPKDPKGCCDPFFFFILFSI